MVLDLHARDHILHDRILGVWWWLGRVTTDRTRKLGLQVASDIHQEIWCGGPRLEWVFAIDLLVVGHLSHVAVVVLAPDVLFEVEDVDPVVAGAWAASVHEYGVKVVAKLPEVHELGVDLCLEVLYLCVHVCKTINLRVQQVRKLNAYS